MPLDQLAWVVRAWRSGSGSFLATSACSAMLRKRVTIGYQVARGSSQSANQAHHRPPAPGSDQDQPQR